MTPQDTQQTVEMSAIEDLVKNARLTRFDGRYTFTDEKIREQIFMWASALLLQELTNQREEERKRAAKIVREHTLWDWSGEQEIYNELEEIAKSIEALSERKDNENT